MDSNLEPKLVLSRVFWVLAVQCWVVPPPAAPTLGGTTVQSSGTTAQFGGTIAQFGGTIAQFGSTTA